jgi:hypothetical protein
MKGVPSVDRALGRERDELGRSLCLLRHRTTLTAVTAAFCLAVKPAWSQAPSTKRRARFRPIRSFRRPTFVIERIVTRQLSAPPSHARNAASGKYPQRDAVLIFRPADRHASWRWCLAAPSSLHSAFLF